jgi:hypothetical protein
MRHKNVETDRSLSNPLTDVHDDRFASHLRQTALFSEFGGLRNGLPVIRGRTPLGVL